MTDLGTIERALIDAYPFCPQPGPQETAYFSEADVLLYGGAAGGGKTALACGLAIQEHQETLFVRRESKQLDGVADEFERILGNRNGLSSSGGAPSKWKVGEVLGKRRKVTFGSCPHLGDEMRYQGRPRDLLIIDEAANMLEAQVHFLKGWVRTTDPNQRCRTLLCSNPPTSAEGMWLLEWFAPWLDPFHPNPAEPGELRYFVVIDGEHVEVPDSTPVEHNNETLDPESRTFIPARVQDNQYLMGTNYVKTLQMLPEPLRSQMLYGDFLAGREDDEYQVIPSEWVKLAQKRWFEKDYRQDQITSVGCDPSRGGRDSSVISKRVGWWFAPLERMQGEDTDRGGKVAGKLVAEVGQSHCPVHVDVIGIGSSVYDHLEPYIGSRAIPVNNAEAASGQDASGRLKFVNRRAADYWRFRELLDPTSGVSIALPPDKTLEGDLCAPRYKLTPRGIQIESKEEIKKRLGRSPDSGDAAVLCSKQTAIIALQRQPGTHITVQGSLGPR